MPGVAAVDIVARQTWWFATVVLTALALWFFAFGQKWWQRALGAVLIVAPHILGAPEPAVLTGPAPTEIGALFAARAFGVGLAAWCMTGALAGWLWAQSPETPS